MTKKFFTSDEVNDLIPQLEHHFRHIILHKKEMAKAAQRLRKAGLAPELLGDIPSGLSEENQELYRRVKSHYGDFKRHTMAIEEMGGEIQDFELGRIAFHSMEGDGESRLLWQLGVTDVAHREGGSARISLEPRGEKLALASFY